MRKRLAPVASVMVLVALSATSSPGAAVLDPDPWDHRWYLGLDPGIWSGQISIRIPDDTGAALQDHRIVTSSGQTLLDLDRLLAPVRPLAVEQGFGVDPDVLARLRQRASRRCGCQPPDLGAYFTVLVSTRDVDLTRVMEALNGHPAVVVAYPVPDRRLIAPPDDIPPSTPSFLDGQGYLLPSPDGIAATYAWTVGGGRGEGITVVDMEAGWDLAHEDLGACVDAMLPGIGTVDPDVSMDYVNHGTAVLGVMVGGDNGYGVTGIVPDAVCKVAPDWTVEHWYDIPRAIVMTAELMEGQPAVIVLEAQTPGPGYDPDVDPQKGLVPVEWEPPVYDAILTAVASGLVVVEAAGNGSENLDDRSLYSDRFDRTVRDSGAIIVGAGLPYGRSAEWYTNFGSRLDVQGWGSQVTTTGYGDLFDGGWDVHQFYTAQFAGTSSASPIVAGAVASLMGAVLWETGEVMDPLTVRRTLVETGTNQASPARHIGPLPDLREAIGTSISICGDGILHADEVCDDWNTGPGDGCSADCTSDESCGNSIVDTAVGEMCDDGNVEAGDGCSAHCLSDETCGNGFVDESMGEVCDDGDVGSGDGCRADCLSDETCGNGVLDEHMDEQCDDGNLEDGDGCSAGCLIEFDTLGGGCGCNLVR